MLKKVVSTLLTLSLGTTAFAGTMGESQCKPLSSNVPCPNVHWDLGIQALYLKPGYGSSFATVAGGPTGFQNISQDYDWGYRISGAYYYNTEHDIAMNWLHYSANDGVGVYSGSYLQLIPGSAITVTANYDNFLQNTFDQVNLVLGQTSNISDQQTTRWFAGLQYANIDVNATHYFNIPSAFVEVTEGVSTATNTSFHGVGPAIGVDYNYHLLAGLNLVANTGASILYGASRYNTGTIYGSGLIVAPAYASKKSVIPEIEAKLGATYDYETQYGVLTVEGGYQAINYFNAIQSQPVGTLALTTNDFNLFGPYFGIKWLG